MKKFFVLLLFTFAATRFAAPNSAQYYYDEAVKLATKGDTIRASDMARESLRRNGNYVPALILLSQILNDSLETKSAEELIQKALRLDAENDKAAILCARIELKLKNNAAFEKCLSTVENKKRLNSDADSLRAQVLIDNGQYALAKRKIDGILRNNPGHTETRVRLAGLYLKLKQFQKAEDEFRKIQSLIPENNELAVAIARARIDAFFKDTPSGIFSLESDAALRALDALRHAYSNNPQNLSVNLMLAQLLAVTGKCNEASDYLNKLIQTEKEMRSVVVVYALCHANGAEEYLNAYLRRNEDDDLTRHQEELLRLSLNQRREHPILTKAARYHYQIAKRAMRENSDAFALENLRWAEFLFPAYIAVHEDLTQYFRRKKDYERLSDELFFLRGATQSREARERVEQFESERRGIWYVKEGFPTPEHNKNPVPIHVYPFRTKDPLHDHPLGGVALSDRTRVALQDYGRVRSISREMVNLPEAQIFTPENLRILKTTYKTAIDAEENIQPFRRRTLGLVLTGFFTETRHGISVEAELVDADSGIRVALENFKAEGRNYLSKASVRLATFVFKNAPLSANILRIQDGESILVNTGKRDRISKGTTLAIFDKMGNTREFKVIRADFDILEAKSNVPNATNHLKAGDTVVLKVEP
ncbi:MAG: hypothetical protein LDLANPLL_01288 [Turneriella sp.]|nr:hypothetical protein [Turneriella sp.]